MFVDAVDCSWSASIRWRTMRQMTARRLSQIAITALFLALVRTLGEYYRLRYVRGPALGLDEVAPYVTGALMAALGVWAAVTAYFFGRFRTSIGIVLSMIAVMIAYKLAVIGGLP